MNQIDAGNGRRKQGLDAEQYGLVNIVMLPLLTLSQCKTRHVKCDGR